MKFILHTTVYEVFMGIIFIITFLLFAILIYFIIENSLSETNPKEKKGSIDENVKDVVDDNICALIKTKNNEFLKVNKITRELELTPDTYSADKFTISFIKDTVNKKQRNYIILKTEDGYYVNISISMFPNENNDVVANTKYINNSNQLKLFYIEGIDKKVYHYIKFYNGQYLSTHNDKLIANNNKYTAFYFRFKKIK